MSRYVVWDKKSEVITPIGEVLSPAQWIQRYPSANVIKTVCAGGEINGAFFGVFSQMVEMYTTAGCDFSSCESDQDYLDAIEVFEDERNRQASENYTDQTRIADALEDLVVLQLTTETEE